MRHVHQEATERVGANRLGRNGMRGRVHREDLDGTGDGNEAWRTAERRKRTSYGRNGGPVDREGCGVPQNGRNGPPVHQEGCGVPQNGTPRDTVHLHRRPPPASTGSCSSSLHRALLHRLLFNHPSTVYYSSSPPHHRVLFNHPSTGTPPPSIVHPALHTTGSCSSRGNTTGSCSYTRTAHCSSKPPSQRSLFIHRQH